MFAADKYIYKSSYSLQDAALLHDLQEAAAAAGHLHQERGRGGLVGDRQAGKGTVGVRCMAYIPLATCTPLISGVRSDSASSFFKARR